MTPFVLSRRELLALSMSAATGIGSVRTAFSQPTSTSSSPSSQPLALGPINETAVPPPAIIPMGSSVNPAGDAINVDNCSLLLRGKRWLPTSGEYHYTRGSVEMWRDELLKMKSGGIDIVATYIFWIHHEEVEGDWDWSGCRDLKRFVALCQEHGLYSYLRIGPWAHGECRNGGFPDWLVHGPYKLRSTDPAYMAKVARVYEQIFSQVGALLWKQGGPIVGIQIENEYSGPPDYMEALKTLAVDTGFDVPLYTRTGWTRTKPALPFGELLPLFGQYPDGFWDRQLTQANSYRNAYLFGPHRAETGLGAIGPSTTGATAPQESAYPYFCCEIGGGMASSYHRRLHIAPMDVAAVALIKLATGNNLQGFYMYHGGTNPVGKL